MGITISTTSAIQGESSWKFRNVDESEWDSMRDKADKVREKTPKGSNVREQEKDKDDDFSFPMCVKEAGPCKDKFVALENCAQYASKNEKWRVKGFCLGSVVALGECVEAHSHYYEELEKQKQEELEKQEDVKS
ncbi:hypothetical protein AgCh_014290 [Apium graveolens]